MPNSHYTISGGLIQVAASCQIPAGEEVTISYMMSPSAFPGLPCDLYEARQATLTNDYYFDCECAFCLRGYPGLEDAKCPSKGPEPCLGHVTASPPGMAGGAGVVYCDVCGISVGREQLKAGIQKLMAHTKLLEGSLDRVDVDSPAQGIAKALEAASSIRIIAYTSIYGNNH